MIRAPGIFRSVTFWSGLLLMAFIGWAWRDSIARYAGVDWKVLVVQNVSAAVLVGYFPASPAPAFAAAPNPWKGEMPLLPAPFFAAGGGRDYAAYVKSISEVRTPAGQWKASIAVSPRGTWLIVLPHWLILLTVAMAWSGLLYWRYRRIRKTAIPAAPPP